MSYTRTVSKPITLYYSRTVSYPASQNGGTINVSGSVTETVNVNVHVDTTPFDSSVSGCNQQVNILTGAVAATEAAQVASVDANSKRVASTIINGFFKTIGSEISQQINELTNEVESLAMHLVELTKRCLEKQNQMGVDYQRICQRYIKVFDTLNTELKNRIHEIDQPVFKFREQADAYAQKGSDSDMVSTVVVTGSEEAKLQAHLSSATLKYQASEMLHHASEYLYRQRDMRSTIAHHMFQDDEGSYYVPLMMTERVGEDGVKSTFLYSPKTISKSLDNGAVCDQIEHRQWEPVSDAEQERVANYFNAEVSSHFASPSAHDERVRETMLNLFSNNRIKRVK
ncbi:MAG: hypothetical protein J5671_07460 [Bacteroidaceae bacterium]|nr:hypothetical protein [Bacteroidaceae bacterium]